MAESICRSLRDGALDGEHAPALTLKDSLQSPHGPHAFNHFLSILLSNISSAKSQSRGVVIVAYTRSPEFYFKLFKNARLDSSLVRILDCYSDPLGWKKETNLKSDSVSICKDVRDADKLLTSILDLGKGFLGEGKARFAVAIDSVSNMLRHASLPSVAGIISNLRGLDRISCVFWLIHSDLHEPRVSAALEYISTMVATLEPLIQSIDGKRSSENLFWLDQNSHKGKFNVHLKRRNGRVKLLCEEFRIEEGGIKFASVSSENVVVNQNLIPKVQFNLQLSEKERVDRARVVLPFEHQGNGEAIQIYDGRRSLSADSDPHLRQASVMSVTNTMTDSGKGEIHYIRDSDDEAPDSDEDPDDDLDI